MVILCNTDATLLARKVLDCFGTGNIVLSLSRSQLDKYFVFQLIIRMYSYFLSFFLQT